MPRRSPPDESQSEWREVNFFLRGERNELYTANFIKNLSKLSKIKDLFSTNVGNTALANYHEMYESGFLGTHVDHSSEPNTGLPHVLNIILYLSKNWDRSWGGSTMFANKNGTKIEKIMGLRVRRLGIRPSGRLEICTIEAQTASDVRAFGHLDVWMSGCSNKVESTPSLC